MPTHAPEASADYITLHGTHTSVVLEVRPHEAPLWRYWGLFSTLKSLVIPCLLGPRS